MFWNRKKKHGLYYLLPGMTRANRRRRKQVFRWSLAVGIVVSILVALILYLVHHL
jgi:hypothetical protein